MCIISLLSIFLLFSCNAYAAGSIDFSKNVNLTISYQDGTVPVVGAEFRIYSVATVDKTGELTLTEKFRRFNVDIQNTNSETWKILASTLEGYVLRDDIAVTDSGKTNQEGYLTFPSGNNKLTQGLYLVLGQRHTQGDFYYDASPFMVMLPSQNAETEEWLYETIVEPKYDTVEIPDIPSTVTRKVLKVWDDAGTENLRPKEIIMQLLRDGKVYDSVSLNTENNWRYTWTGLDGQYTWTVVEKESENYKVSVTREDITFIVTNTYSPYEPQGSTVTRKIIKVWDDKGYENQRPKSVQVTLLLNGTAYDTVTLNEENDWSYTWESLPKYGANGTENNWTIREDDVSGYTSDLKQNGSTFVLTNIFAEPELPHTGALWWPVPLLAVGGMAFLIIGDLSRKKKEDE